MIVKIWKKFTKPPNYGRNHVHSSLYKISFLVTSLLIHICHSSHIPPSLSLESSKNETGSYISQTVVTNKENDEKRFSFTANCTDSVMTIYGMFGVQFKGRIYAIDYPDEDECGVNMAKTPSQNITFQLPLGVCGIQMSVVDNTLEAELQHEVTLYIQYSAYLQQIVDEKVSVLCREDKSIPAITESSNYLLEEQESNSRQGRRMKYSGRDLGLSKPSTRIGEAIMEIINGRDPSPKSKKIHPVAVGEDVTLVISTKVLRGFDARIVNCTTHDGSRSSSNDGSRNQPILDSSGCSVDQSLVPNFRKRRLPVESRNRLLALHFASFPAFKFPERDHLHIQCTVAYCQGHCPHEPCDGSNHYGTWREKYGRIADVLVETSHVVNAIEVLSPDLDSPGGHHYERRQGALSSGNDAVQDPPSVNRLPLPSIDTPPQQRYNPPTATHYSKNPPSYQYFNNGQQQNIPQYKSNHNGQRQMSNIPESSEMNGIQSNSVCISPGTVIIALVVLALVLVVSVTATLWFALKRSEAKKYAESHKSAFSNLGPAPYYRFNQW